MAFTDKITNASAITILQPIDNNYKTGGGDLSVGGCLVIASKGKPFTPQAIYGGTTDIEDIFGTPLPKKAAGMEGLRHVHDASEECSYVNAVRVVNADSYRFPSLTFLLCNDLAADWAPGIAYNAGDVVAAGGQKYLCVNAHASTPATAPDAEGQTEWELYTGPVKTAAHKYDASIVVGEGAYMSIYPIDGDASANRTVRITKINAEEERFTLAFYDKDSLGDQYLLEEYTVGIGDDDKDDMGLSAYVETVSERESDRFRIACKDGVTWAEILPALQASLYSTSNPREFAFVGGTAGGDVRASDWQLGVNVFHNERVACDLLFAAGIYDKEILSSLASIADERHIAFFYDVLPGLKCAEAIEWDQEVGITSRHARAYYSPYSAYDPWRGGQCVWGVSGAMAAAKARCNKIVNVGDTPGVHYAPAGENRSYLTRTGLAALFPEDRIDREALYDQRINPILPIASGGCGADDDLTHWFKTNYLRFGWINDVLDYIDHRFYEQARQVKFEPDGLTKDGLTDAMTSIMENLVTSGALVTPRDTATDGTNPYVITVEQQDIDIWKVTWEVCITGAARRIVGQPVLIK